MKFVIIGGSGFIGSELASQIHREKQRFSIIDIRPSASFRSEYVYGDVTDIDSLHAAMAQILENVDPGSVFVVNLAAEHRDDVKPKSKYLAVNVNGAKNLTKVMDFFDIKNMLFTSSVAVYGFASPNTDESGDIDPFNEYGVTKWKAETVYQQWSQQKSDRHLTIIRPTVVFGPGNRGNVHNLFRQVARRRFVMIGTGQNRKSMAFVANVAAFIRHCAYQARGTTIYNYVDKPDLNMWELVDIVRKELGFSEMIRVRVPYWVGFFAGGIADIIATTTRKSLPISRLRVQKFVSISTFDATAAKNSSFQPPFTLRQGIRKTIEEELEVYR